MSNEANDTLGTIIKPGMKRDAIRVAVIPAVASCELSPGDHVGLLPNGEAGYSDRKLGVVDPFLVAPVCAGEIFWLVIYPRRITSLRHVWTHPDLPAEVGADDASAPPGPTKEESERWLRNFADSHDVPNYETLIAAASGEPAPVNPDYGAEWEHNGEWITFYGRDAHCEIPEEFWWHLENLKGRKLQRAEYFSCSC